MLKTNIVDVDSEFNNLIYNVLEPQNSIIRKLASIFYIIVIDVILLLVYKTPQCLIHVFEKINKMIILRKYLLIFVIILSVEAKLQGYSTEGPVKKIGSRYYKRELLTNEYEDPKELAYDSSSRHLYFMYMDEKIQNSGRAYVNAITKQSRKIPGIQKNKATAVDSESGDVYFGSEDGLYKYDPIENVAINIGLYNMNILQLVVKENVIYFIDANDHNLYKVFNDGSTAVKLGSMGNLIIFDIDNERNVFYVSLCGLYCAVRGQEIVKNNDLSSVDHFITDDRKTFGIKDSSVYELNCLNGTAVKIADLDFVPRSITYGDYGDIYYSVNNDIYRLNPISSYVVYILYKDNATQPWTSK